MKVLIISHNPFLQSIAQRLESDHDLELLFDKDIDWDSICEKDYDVIWSFHCVKIFPEKVINKFKCLNIHPGYNPHNRGHAPQVFSIINGQPCGVTVHFIDKHIDHGKIIYQEKIDIHDYDTSGSVYKRILRKEEELLLKNFDLWTEEDLCFSPRIPGNINYKKDFYNMCKLDMESVDTLENHVKLLRALTHDDFNNAYFIDKEGNKVYIQIKVKKES